MQTSPLKFLPLLFVFLVVGGAVIAYTQLPNKKKIQNVTTKLPEPTPFITIAPFRGDSANTLPKPVPTATPLPTAIETELKATETKGGQKIVSSTTTRTETVCTPVYGMANSCAEHAVVDTGLETSAFPTFAALSYVGGLAAFIKAKKRA